MEEGRKRLRRDDSGDVSGNTATALPEGEGESDSDDDIMAWLSIDEDSAGELMELLEPETTSPMIKMKFIDNPYVSTLIFQSSASYVTINGNEESCGSSFSDSDASIMASIDMGSVRVHSVSGCGWEFPAGSGGGWGLDETALGRNGDGFDGWDCFDLDDDSLAMFLGEDLFLETLKNQE